MKVEIYSISLRIGKHHAVERIILTGFSINASDDPGIIQLGRVFKWNEPWTYRTGFVPVFCPEWTLNFACLTQSRIVPSLQSVMAADCDHKHHLC